MNETENLFPEMEEKKLLEEETVSGSQEKRMKNLTSAVVLLAGLFIGSLFVDIGQLVSKEGFSPRAVRENNVLIAGGKTWVAYADPLVHVTAITDDTCGECAPDEALVWLRRVLPTMEASPVQASSDEGKTLIEKLDVKTLPAFVFSKEIASTDFYTLASEIFVENDGRYLLDTARLGIAPGKYLTLPKVSENDIVIGSLDAKVKVVEYSDFQCPYCRTFHPTVQQMLNDYGQEIVYVYKHLPLSFHPQAENAALASECANEQGKFEQYMNTLFAKQSEWGNTQGTQSFKTYARSLGLKAADFNACLDEKKYLDKVNADAAEAAEFGVNGTPGVFIGDKFFAGAAQWSDVKATLDEQLAK